MGRSILPPQPLPAGRVTHTGSGSVIAARERDGRMIHTLAEGGLTAEFPMQYQIGGRLMGRTYVMQIGRSLFESPISWFNRAGWDMSPGYAHQRSIDFDRPIEQQCLFCHAGKARFDVDGRQLQDARLSAITCERCHGDGETHTLHPSAKNIVNPAKLTGSTRDSVCEQCHLEGVTRVLNTGKNWNDFHAGEPAEKTFATYVEGESRSAEVIAVGHVEQLAQSQCARNSGGKLWCGTCHDPHGTPAANRAAGIRAKCIGCHATLSASAHAANNNGQSPAECTSCHMPRKDTTDIAHAAVTDHRILRRPTAIPGPASIPEKAALVAWREPDAIHRERDLAMAQVVAGYARNAPELSSQGLAGLQALPEAAANVDGPVLSALEGFALQAQKITEAVRLGKQSVIAQPQSAKAAMNYAIILKRAGDSGEAERQLNRAIDLDPSLKPAYIELGMLYASQRQLRPMLDTMDRYLRWNPQDILFNLQKARLPAQP